MGKYAEVTPVHTKLLVCLNSLQELRVNKFPNPGFPSASRENCSIAVNISPMHKEGPGSISFPEFMGYCESEGSE